jgi:outer membrane protein OmpA-like peptidoglycan-associated protein
LARRAAPPGRTASASGVSTRELAQTIGDRDAAREVLCADEEIYRVYNAMGRPCRLKPDGSANPAFVAPPASPPPPPMPSAAVVVPGPYLVFFDWNRSDITTEAAVTLDKAASSYQQTGVATVQVTGHTDTSGTPAYNMELSMRRAEAVKAYLAGRGVPRDVMVLRGMGETAPLVPTGEGARCAQPPGGDRLCREFNRVWQRNGYQHARRNHRPRHRRQR